ncbi:hypothetical protein QQS21_002262 [Conoideocrella luteorostrata]|uniref:Uncharacterized protein n=1 Tax=Conoideocrella luteorostrata TaxID=1105319 RepID=A0AAJ0CVI4_9HYPO|nr:hypothetical protein QQS21_002262 [Conoideocrella luteorostrata]
MFYKCILGPVVLASLAMGLPKSQLTEDAGRSNSTRADINWSIDSVWSWDASSGFFNGGFDISAPANYFRTAPSFEVTCWRGHTEPDDWRKCAPSPDEVHTGAVFFRRLPRQQDGLLEDVWVSHQFLSGGFAFNVTGYALVDWTEDIFKKRKMPVVSKQVS